MQIEHWIFNLQGCGAGVKPIGPLVLRHGDLLATGRSASETGAAELRQEVHELGILFEDLGSNFQVVIEGLDNHTQETKRNFAKVRRELREKLAPMEGALKDFGRRVTKNDQHLSQHDQQLREHDQRLNALESAAA